MSGKVKGEERSGKVEGEGSGVKVKVEGRGVWWKAVPEEVWRSYRPLVTWTSTKRALLAASGEGGVEVEESEDDGEGNVEEASAERKVKMKVEQINEAEDQGSDVEKNRMEYVCEVGRDLKITLRRKEGK